MLFWKQIFTTLEKHNYINQTKIYQALFDSAAEGLVLVDPKGLILLVNQSLMDMFGYDQEELVGQSIGVLIPKIHRKAHEKHMDSYNQAPRKRQMGIGMSLAGLRKDGSEFPVEISLNHIPTEGGHLTMGLVTDISTRQKIEIENKKILEILRKIHLITTNHSLNHVEKIKALIQLVCDKYKFPIGMFSRLEEGKFSFESIISETENRQDIQSSNPIQRLIYKTAENSSLYFRSSKLENLDLSNDLHFIGIKVLLDGKTYGVLSFLATNKNHLANTEMDYELLKLISEGISGEAYRLNVRKRLEGINERLDYKIKERTAELLKSEALYKAIARNFPDGTINVLDRDLDYIFVEGKELHKRQVSSESLLGSNYLRRLPENISEQLQSSLEQVFKGIAQSFEIELDKQHYLLDAVPLTNGEADIHRILVVERNITIQKEAEGEMIKALEKERELNELKSRFVSMASHEFRTPLGTILSSASLIGRYKETEQQDKRDKHINRIKTSISNLTNILNDFLSLEKLESGKISIHSDWFDLPRFCKSTIEDMQDVCKKGQVLHYEHEGDSLVFLDELLIRNILFNLISNAIKYSSQEQGVSIRTKNTENTIELIVKDEGMGIPKKEQAHLFERFFRAANATNIQGTGLGLHIVKRYVSSLNGEIAFESEEGKGSTFSIYLQKND